MRRVEKWIEKVTEEQGSDLMVVLVGFKTDLQDSRISTLQKLTSLDYEIII